MTYTKKQLLLKALEITRDHARGGSDKYDPAYVLRAVYEELKKVNKELNENE